MRSFAQTADRITATTKKLEKTALLADYFRSVPAEEAAIAAVFFSGRPFPAWEEATLQVGGTILWRTVEELSGASDAELTAAYRKYGDLGDVAGTVLIAQAPRPSESASLRHLLQSLRAISSARGTASKGALVRELLASIGPSEAKYVIKIITGELRIGLKESLVEEAIAKAFGAPVKDVQRANMLLGDIGETLILAAQGQLVEARMRLFHPIGSMLASPAESADDALSYFENAWVEDKYDGIRAQAHCDGEQVRFFSRTHDEITESFPELPGVLAGLPSDAILDGEIVAWSNSDDDLSDEAVGAQKSLTPGRALPFSALQRRLGRKKVSEQLIREVPVAYLVFDILYAGGELLIEKPLRERAQILDQLLAATRPARRGNDMVTQQGQLAFQAHTTEDTRYAPTLIRAPVFQASNPADVNALFDAAQARGNEGLMIKDPESPYTPGRRGKSWLKLKRELATLDVVVTAAEYGHGKRIGVLSDYTFAVRDGDGLLNIGKAYSGLTDAEIAEMTKWFLDHTIEDQGFRRVVEPRVVLEVAFNNLMKSDRHSSGYALRFPRIVRLRPDKLPEEADTLERVREIYQQQGH
jgi:DNA ligase-1